MLLLKLRQVSFYTFNAAVYVNKQIPCQICGEEVDSKGIPTPDTRV